MKLIAVDPGLSGMGWARWDTPTRTKRGPNAVGVIYPSKLDKGTGTLTDQCTAMTSILWDQVFDDPIVPEGYKMVIEMPQHMASAKGIAAQAGSVYKLTFLVGFIAAMFHDFCQVHVATPMEWKGQLPKNVVQQRIERDLGLRFCRDLQIRSHAWDAVGLGLWFRKSRKGLGDD